jgi:hypothetical protein
MVPPGCHGADGVLPTVGVPPSVGLGVAVGVVPDGEAVTGGVARAGKEDLVALGDGRAAWCLGVAVARGVAGADVAGCALAGAAGPAGCACATGLGRTSR